MMFIGDLPREKVLAALYNASRPQGMGFMHYDANPMGDAEAADLLKTHKYFDYLNGRVMKVDLSTDQLETRLYNRDNGHDAAEHVIETLRGTMNTNAPEIASAHKAGVHEAAALAEKSMRTPTTIERGPNVTVAHLELDDVADELAPKVKAAVESL